METKYFLHHLVRHSNVQQPKLGKIDYNEYPTQDLNKIGSRVTCDFIDERFVPGNFNKDSHDYDIEYPDRKLQKDFIIIRYDDPELYEDAIAVYISDDGDVMITQKDKIICTIVTPDDMDHFIGMKVKPEYKDRSLTREAYILAIQAIEPGFCVVVEYIGSSYRVILDTELFFEYDPEDIYVPRSAPDVNNIRKKLLEDRVPYHG